MHQKFFTTITLFLTWGLIPLIYWATPQQTFSCKHSHFSGDFNNVEGIGDCTEQWIQRSSNPKAQYQTYSIYKSHSSVKNLVFCSKSVPLRYSVIAYSTSATDRLTTEDTNIGAQFTPDYFALFDKGFQFKGLIFTMQNKCQNTFFC